MELNNKLKLGLFLLIMVCFVFISISSVSATDVNVTTFKEMNTQIQVGNDVTLVKDITGLDGLKDGITIKGKTTVNGNGHSIDAQLTGRFFKIESSGILTLKNITLKNGKLGLESGGAIYNNGGTLTVKDSTFTDNHADGDFLYVKRTHYIYGGAIYNNGGTLTVIGSTFNKNNALNAGGAIYNNGGTLIVTGSTFNSNTAMGCSQIVMPRSFDEVGGAICNNRGTLTVTDSTFDDNSAHDCGGAIYNREGSLTVTGSTFNNNKVSGGSSDSDDGGAIYNANGKLSVAGSTFSNNYACDNGGAISNQEGTLTITGSTFNNNHAGDDGGAIWSSNTLTCTGSIFKGNTANNGGAIYTDSSLYVKNCIFIENKVTQAGASSADGGAIRCYNLGECKNCTFIKNIADNGGAIAIIDGKDTYTVRDCIFQENQAIAMKGGVNGQGGAIFLNKVKSTINLVHNQWINNHATKRGNNVYSWGYYGTIEYNYFVGADDFREHKHFGSDKDHKDPKRCFTLKEWNKHYSNSINKNNSPLAFFNPSIFFIPKNLFTKKLFL